MYTILILGACFHKVMVFKKDTRTIVVCALQIAWVPLEYFRIRFGYRGNITETFPDLIAFLIFTLFFTIPISILPLFQQHYYPHERAVIWMNIIFDIFEFIVGMNVV